MKIGKRIKELSLPLFAIMLFVLIWHIIAGSGLFLTELFPYPHEVFYAFLEVLKSGDLATNLVSSLLRVAMGFAIAVILAVPLGLLIGWHSSLWKSLYPLIQIFRTISPVAWIPLAILWFGIGDAPAIFIVAITAFFPLLISCVFAVKSIDPLLIKVARNFGATDSQVLWRVILPGSISSIMIALRVSLGFCWMIIVAAEMVGMRSGLGYMILDARNFLRTDLVMAGMIVIGLVGLVIDRIMTALEIKFRKHLIPLESRK